MGWVCVVNGNPGTWYEWGAISKSIDKEYGSIDYLADTLSVTTTYKKFEVFQNRPRSIQTVMYADDSLRTTNAGNYRLSGYIVAASADTGVTLTIGISQNNAVITDDGLTATGHLDKISQFQTISFNFFIGLAPLTSVKPKIKVGAGTHNIYIRRAWMTVERLN
jgi:hypothetical protein